MVASSVARGDEAPAVEVWITPTIERDFKRREVFPSLRIENARKVVNGATGVYTLTLEEAQELEKDAQEQYHCRTLPKGLPVAYVCLLRALRPAIKAARGDREDPGREAVAAQAAAASALFRLGDRVRYCSPWMDEKDDGVEMVITGDYAFRQVSVDDKRAGAFITPEGRRVVYRWGYCAQRIDRSVEYFYPAGQIQTMDYEPGHLRLVKS